MAAVSVLRPMRPLFHNLRSVEAAEIAEAALVLPVVFLFLLGIIWFGRAFNIYSTIQQAAQQGAIAAARPTCATCAPSNSFPDNTAVFNKISAVMQANNLATGQIVNANPPAPTFCTSPPLQSAGACAPAASNHNITICRGVLLNPPLSTTQLCGTTITFQYPFTFNVPFASPAVNLTAQAQSRMEN